MEKKMWSKPEIRIVAFVPGDYCVSSCRSNSAVVDYHFDCDASMENTWKYSWLFADNNSAKNATGDRVFNFDSSRSYDACNSYWEVTPKDAQSFSGLISYVSSYQSEYDQSFRGGNYFISCNKTHDAPSNDVFLSGWFVPGTDAAGGIDTDKAKEVTIWTENNSNLHATFTLIENLEYSRS